MANVTSEPIASVMVIHYISGKYFVWNADTVLTLRTKHRVCGHLVGSTPRKAWQATVHSLPLMLTPAEAHFCYKSGIAKIVEGSDYFTKRKVTMCDLLAFRVHREKMECDQIKIFKTEKGEREKLLFGSHGNKLSRRAKRNLAEVGIEASTACDSSDVENPVTKSAKTDGGLCPGKADTGGLPINSTSQCSEVASQNIFTSQEESTSGSESMGELLNGESCNEPCHDASSRNEVKESEINWAETKLSDSDFEYYGPSVYVHIPTDSTSKHSFTSFVSKYPMSEREKCSCAVYEDLHKRGFFVTSSLKFGGDFLVYLADPLRHHSHYIVVVLNKHDALSAKDLITYGRLSASVKKTVVFATLNCDMSSVDYLSLTWAQMK